MILDSCCFNSRGNGQYFHSFPIGFRKMLMGQIEDLDKRSSASVTLPLRKKCRRRLSFAQVHCPLHYSWVQSQYHSTDAFNVYHSFQIRCKTRGSSSISAEVFFTQDPIIRSSGNDRSSRIGQWDVASPAHLQRAWL